MFFCTPTAQFRRGCSTCPQQARLPLAPQLWGPRAVGTCFLKRYLSFHSLRARAIKGQAERQVHKRSIETHVIYTQQPGRPGTTRNAFLRSPRAWSGHRCLREELCVQRRGVVQPKTHLGFWHKPEIFVWAPFQSRLSIQFSGTEAIHRL